MVLKNGGCGAFRVDLLNRRTMYLLLNWVPATGANDPLMLAGLNTFSLRDDQLLFTGVPHIFATPRFKSLSQGPDNDNCCEGKRFKFLCRVGNRRLAKPCSNSRASVNGNSKGIV